MAETLSRIEAIPASYPDAPGGLTAAAAALDSDMIWQRIEAYVAHRWTARAVVWTVEGGGDWQPDLTPATVSAVEVWQDHDWTAVTLNASPLGGYVLDGDGPYRFTVSVGSVDVPAAVSEAFRRLAEYMAEVEKHPGVSAFKSTVGPITLEQNRVPSWLARAMQFSGAGDLLRPYRRT